MSQLGKRQVPKRQVTGLPLGQLEAVLAPRSQPDWS
jgi:hypothetical protein